MILVVNLLTGALAMLLDPRLRGDGLKLGGAAS
jgi:hypothetical protein